MQDRLSAGKLRNRLKMISIRECLQDRVLPQLAFTCIKLTTETLEQGVKCIQS